jgi:hypothetical protein
MHDHAKEQLIQMLRKSISEAAIEPNPEESPRIINKFQ